MTTLPTTNTNLGDEQIKTLVQAGIIPANTPPAQIAVFAAVCREKGLSAFTKEAYLVSYAGTYSTIVGINGLRKIAAQTGTLAGVDDAKYNVQPDGQYLTASQLKANNKTPNTCTVTVYRLIGGVRYAFTKTVLWEEYCPINVGGKWKTMGFNMIEKCAEAAALRMGFADETAGLHIPEERAAYEDNSISAAQANPALTVDVEELQGKIDGCQTADELMSLYKSNSLYTQFADLFTARKNELV